MSLKAGNEGARARAEGDDAPEDDAPASARGIDPPSKCGTCTVQNETDAKYCKGCGASMATGPVAEEEEAPPSSKPMPAPGAAARMAPAASLADVLGLQDGASLPAQKAAAIDLRMVFDHAAKLTGQRSPAAIVGGLTAIATDAASTGRMRAERNAIKAKQDTAERLDLCKRLVACGAEQRGRVFVDAVSDDGKRTEAPALTPQFAEMRLPTLRGLVEGHEKNAAPRNPYEPNRDAAQAARLATRPDGLDEKAQIERAKSDPAVLRMFHRAGNTHTLDAIAAQFVKTLATAGGAP